MQVPTVTALRTV